MKLKIKNLEAGQLSLYVLIFGSVAIVILSGFILWADLSFKAAIRQTDRLLALEIAESGIEYYRWHLAHVPDDFQDGTGEPGPYEHDFFDKNGNIIGKFTLEITPPSESSGVVIIKSTGTVDVDDSIERIVEARLALSSLAGYAIVSNDSIHIGQGAEVFGPIHSNGGISFNGIAHHIVTSTRETYDDPAHAGVEEYAVHTHINPADPLPPNPLQKRPSVFKAGRDFPVPAVDFDGIARDLSDIKTGAQASGSYFGPSSAEGYRVVLKTNDTFDLYKVNSQIAPPAGCTNDLSESDWGTWSIDSETFLNNYALPSNGLIFFEDNAWIEGEIDGERLTLATGIFPESPGNYKHIIVNNNLTYSNINARDKLGLVTQGNIIIGMESTGDLRIDAAIVAKNGRVGRFYYNPSCSPYHNRQSLTIYGMIATNEKYGFAYTDGTGYQQRSITYDPRLLSDPPPGFPSDAGFYEIISWKELK
ncbi:MAG: hypothetical protein COV29_03825 [Candidatus Yanofskybacteria bacterium CG10_big_fil_rev_8_21_14_0_10_36_16]|uniref:Uncharacterized protein n=1 Tax=Candidatus Yanofskybacteria bacterium CG10_big_fil_rev_8_21_14_0_10_36_16 TaxID=1975096 RepID=A0A2J0Q6Y8_9BACT|nr:MAG: hypothetical protein COV29_03825 [Candidatus Yanofskybacteria bacterium CG10_big_fil_rev_8_21_14_0_10_36_16]